MMRRWIMTKARQGRIMMRWRERVGLGGGKEEAEEEEEEAASAAEQTLLSTEWRRG